MLDAHLGGHPVEIIGIESRPIPRRGRYPADGPDQWTAGTLFPQSSKKTARAINAASGNRPVVVLRFDGIRKRGESHNDPDCLEPGKEHHRFTFSQGVQDISATLDFLERSSEFAPSKTILVTFSAASIDGRAAVVRESAGRIAGWVCVVGAPDLQSAMRVISRMTDSVKCDRREAVLGISSAFHIVCYMTRNIEQILCFHFFTHGAV